MSNLMDQFAKTMGITKIRTTPYHPMSNGLCENFNGVLKSMLKKYASEFPRAWDKFIPYLLFAYREVPQASTGFSPFEFGFILLIPITIIAGITSQMSPEYVLYSLERSTA